MPDRTLPCCRGAGCAQGKHPEACDCGHPLQEFPSLKHPITAAAALVVIALALLLSHLYPWGVLTP